MILRFKMRICKYYLQAQKVLVLILFVMMCRSEIYLLYGGFFSRTLLFMTLKIDKNIFILQFKVLKKKIQEGSKFSTS